MKVCHVNLASGFHGGENQTLQLIKQQLKMGYETPVVANPRSPLSDAVKALGCRYVPAEHFLTQHKRSVTECCSLIHVHEGRAIYWALIQNFMFGIPYIVTRRIDNPLRKRWLSNLAYSRASAVIGLSNEIVTRIQSAYPELAVHRIPSSPVIYPSDYSKAEGIKQYFDNKFLVIHAANMLSHKGFEITIDAARRLLSTSPDIHFALLGDGSIRSQLENRASDLPNVSFVGHQEDMGNWFEAADLLVHPAHSEGLGSVILEALAAGLPVVATRAGGIPDIIEHEVSGLLVGVGNSTDLAESILRLKNDDQLRRTVYEGANAKLRIFRIAHTAQLYESIYQSLTNEL